MYSESTGDKNELLRIGSDTIPQEIQTNKSFLLIHSVHIKSCQVEKKNHGCTKSINTQET